MAFVYRTLFFIIGLTILSFGISMTIKAGLGTGAWDALNVGLSKTVGLTPGSWVVIVGIIMIFINASLVKRRPDIAAVITLLITGLLIDFWLLRVLDDLAVSGYGKQFGVFLIGMTALSFGLAVYLQPKFPLIPIDNFMMALRERFNLNLMAAKTLGEVIALSAAFIFKGPIGIGTLIVTFAIGPLIQLFYPYCEKLYNKLLTSAR
ncbi:YczE/YyaS/YitT family protein [Mesobacillus jeotgali]|uniref:YczE/YyaS/YitT family protein n=1 Tax=Mesobacillus jeotgali TaxID=129985 RepID=UPI0009A5DF64|nr:membrane protein [Mesobacillus jeotgali]